MTQQPALSTEHLSTTERFKSIFRRHPAAVAVVTFRTSEDAPGAAPGALLGFTATSITSVSADPPSITFSLDRTSSCAEPMRRASSVAVSLLREDQASTASRFATRGIDRFAAGGWTVLPTGEAIVTGAHAWLRCRLVERLDVGGGTLAVAQVTDSGHPSTGSRPLIYHDRGYHELGRELGPGNRAN